MEIENINTSIQRQDPITPAQLLELAVSKDLDVDKLTKLVELQRNWEADQARKAFFEALNDFQSECPEIRKAKKVSFDTSKGKTEYNFAPLADITRQIKSVCKKFGLSYRWQIADVQTNIEVTCLITHIQGHTEKTTISAGADISGSKNPIQARGSAIEYLKRYTLIGALGISTSDSDVDGEIPEIDIDILHKQYMVHYNQLIQIDSKYSKWAPENWKHEPTRKVYLQGIKAIREELLKVTPKPL